MFRLLLLQMPILGSQLKLDYDNGLEIWVNGNKEETWETPNAELPPNRILCKITEWGPGSIQCHE